MTPRSTRNTIAHSQTPLLPNAQALILLAEIEEAGSITEAAKRLGISQPAVSKQLRKLEEALQVPLFERGTRGLQPTPEGQALLPRARTIRSQLRQADEDLRQLHGARNGQLVLALSHFATITLLPEVIRRFRKNWPEVRVSIIPPTFALEGLREGHPNFAVMSLPSRKLGSEYVARPLYATHVALVVRSGHPAVRAHGLQDLTPYAWVLPSLDSSVARGLERAFRNKRLPAPHCAITCQTLTGLETLVRETDLIGAMPAEVFQARQSASGLKRIQISELIEGPRVALLRWADGKPTPAAADMENDFREVAHALARKAASC